MNYFISKSGLQPQFKTSETPISIREALRQAGEEINDKLSVTFNGTPTNDLDQIVQDGNLIYITRLAKDGR